MAISSKKIKRSVRENRKIRIRKKIVGSDSRPRLCVYRSLKHISAQVISDDGHKVLLSASTQEPAVQKEIANVNIEGLPSTVRSSKSLAGAKAVGIVLAKRSLDKKIANVVFDRNGFVYHGRVKALADGAREGGLKF